MKNLTQDQWAESLKNDESAQIIDVRTEEEYIEGYIPEAKNLDIHGGQEFIDEVNKLDKSKNYYVYCRSGARSAQACAIMNQEGFDNAYNLMGGITEWEGEIQK